MHTTTTETVHHRHARALAGTNPVLRQLPPSEGTTPRVPLCSLHDDPEVWFSDRDDHAGVFEAKAWCGRCLFRDVCLEYAMVNRVTHGIWGGLTEDERRRLGRRWRREGSR